MKKLLIVAVAVMALAVASYGQGEVNFANSSTTLITTNQNGVSGNMSGAGNYRIGLYVGAVGSSSNGFTLAGSGLNGPLAGRFNANPATGFFAIPGSPAGTQIDFQVRAWAASAGATFPTDPSLLRGWSTVGRTTPGGGTVLPGVIFGSSTPDAAGNFGVGAFQMTGAGVIVPEPSSIALGLLGLGAIALFRRRK